MMSAACQLRDEDGRLAIKPHWFLPLVHGHVDQASKLRTCTVAN